MAEPVDFVVTVEGTVSGPVIVVEGEVDLAVVAQLDEAVTQALPFVTDRLVFDLAGCSYMDSSGLGVLVRARRQLSEGATLVVRRPHPRVRTVLEITKLDTVLTIEDE
jgi:anti-sigma B factor antagonist